MNSANIFEFVNDQCIDFVAKFSNALAFVEAFKTKYGGIIAHHATNLSDKEVAEIKVSGLKISDINLLKAKAIDRFLPLINPNETGKFNDMVDDFFKDPEMYTQVKEINFGLVKDDLQTKHYHYLLFGAESLLPLADELKKAFFKNFRNAMCDSGRHYMIEAIIPIENTEDRWIEGIYEYVNGAHESSFVIYDNLPPKSIVKIEEVARPRDFNRYCFI